MKSNLTEFGPPQFINTDWRIGIVHTMYNKQFVGPMVEGAMSTLLESDIKKDNILSLPVFGSFEVPLAGAVMAKEKRIDALIGFGVIIQGETMHADHLARETARATMDVQIQYNIPFAYEILHVHNESQLPERTSGSYNKGIEAAYSVLHSLALLKRMQS